MVGGNESERVRLSEDRTLMKELQYEDYSSDLRSFLGISRSTRDGPWAAIARDRDRPTISLLIMNNQPINM
jgi:hypothetical protein